MLPITTNEEQSEHHIENKDNVGAHSSKMVKEDIRTQSNIQKDVENDKGPQAQSVNEDQHSQ